jgi:hypothetical protein
VPLTIFGVVIATLLMTRLAKPTNNGTVVTRVPTCTAVAKSSDQ